MTLKVQGSADLELDAVKELAVYKYIQYRISPINMRFTAAWQGQCGPE
jgi:hypothetical protein